MALREFSPDVETVAMALSLKQGKSTSSGSLNRLRPKGRCRRHSDNAPFPGLLPLKSPPGRKRLIVRNRTALTLLNWLGAPTSPLLCLLASGGV